MHLVLATGEFISPDVATEIGHAVESQITDYPVDTGMPFADAIRRQPRRLTATIVFSAQTRDDFGAPIRDSSRPQQMFDRLVELWTAGTTFHVVTPREVLADMTVERASISDSSSSDSSLTVVATFKQLLTVRSRLIRIPAARRQRSMRSKGAVKPATVAAKAVASPTATADTTAALTAALLANLGK